MKLKILILLSTLSYSTAQACLSASQERIIPVGTLDGNMIALEAECGRFGMGEFGSKPYWRYLVNLKQFRPNYTDTLLLVFSVGKILKQENVKDFIDSLTNIALKFCNSIAGFKPFGSYQIGLCHMEKGCSEIKLVRSDSSYCLAGITQDHLYPIAFLEAGYSGILGGSYRDFFNAYKSEERIAGDDLRVSSIRIYQNKSLKVTIVHLATGHIPESVGEGPVVPAKQPQKVESKPMAQSGYVEPVMHHGKGFDFYVLTN